MDERTGPLGRETDSVSSGRTVGEDQRGEGSPSARPVPRTSDSAGRRSLFLAFTVAWPEEPGFSGSCHGLGVVEHLALCGRSEQRLSDGGADSDGEISDVVVVGCGVVTGGEGMGLGRLGDRVTVMRGRAARLGDGATVVGLSLIHI